MTDDNSRYVLTDLENIYELPSNIDRLRVFINEKTRLSIRNDNIGLFLNLREREMTLGVQVIGTPEPHSFDAQDKYYLEDYNEIKIFRTKLEKFNLFEAEAGDIFESIEVMISNLFESEESRPSVIRLNFNNWQILLINLRKICLRSIFS